MSKKKALKSYDDWKLERLQKLDYAAEYLKTSFDETLNDGDFDAFFIALKDVVIAHGGVQDIAEEADITRQHLHRLVKGEGNPTIQTLASVLKALNLSLDFVPLED